jgi:hypothetical protein
VDFAISGPRQSAAPSIILAMRSSGKAHFLGLKLGLDFCRTQ